MAQPKKVNYLNNKDILKEIHKSKMTFCHLADDKYFEFDVILEDVSKINRNSIKVARENRASIMQSIAYQAAMAVHDINDYKNKPKQKEFAVDPKSIAQEDLVFRVMCMEHIPLEFGRKKNPKNEAETKAKVNFPPFKHPFAYYTAGVNNSFTRVLNIEKRNQTIRDDILIDSGHLPSYGRQIQHENELRQLREIAESEIENNVE